MEYIAILSSMLYYDLYSGPGMTEIAVSLVKNLSFLHTVNNTEVLAALMPVLQNNANIVFKFENLSHC